MSDRLLSPARMMLTIVATKSATPPASRTVQKAMPPRVVPRSAAAIEWKVITALLVSLTHPMVSAPESPGRQPWV
ncbi:hypothetical protein KZ829_34530 [Actinoplanes hulinensis]|uniref:Uncharacterized protein n=1 Tax=Actinoplanes hulinensis TaxID=1144547 RepID=A0ABS7BDT5_9ACTN|nr:hypothetical protein [Actinoplanes hulinensis]MBW6438859.1 hypothetical protein [Actinoplanes hulinensis]